jgi:hypothetical protein
MRFCAEAKAERFVILVRLELRLVIRYVAHVLLSTLRLARTMRPPDSSSDSDDGKKKAAAAKLGKQAAQANADAERMPPPMPSSSNGKPVSSVTDKYRTKLAEVAEPRVSIDVQDEDDDGTGSSTYVSVKARRAQKLSDRERRLNLKAKINADIDERNAAEEEEERAILAKAKAKPSLLDQRAQLLRSGALEEREETHAEKIAKEEVPCRRGIPHPPRGLTPMTLPSGTVHRTCHGRICVHLAGLAGTLFCAELSAHGGSLEAIARSACKYSCDTQ